MSASDKPPIRLPETKFYGKAWMSVAAATILGCFGIFALIMGPLFLFGIIKDVRGQPATDAGIALCALAIPTVLTCCLAVFNCRMKMRPVVQLFQQGIEVKQIGRTSLDGVPMIPVAVRLGWAILSRQGFRVQPLRCQWSSFLGSQITGVPLRRVLTIYGDLEPTGEPGISIGDDELQAKLETVRDALQFIRDHPAAIEDLPAWDTFDRLF